MQIIDGKMVYETEHCFMCDGKGLSVRLEPCPNYGKATHGKACVHCGAKNMHSHGHLNTGKMETCPYCKGKGRKPETHCSTMPDELWQSLELRVYRRVDRENSWNEAFLGLGCVFSCQDYGAAWASTDEKIIEDVQGHQHHQACKVAKDDGTICDHVGIFVNRNGYSVRAVYGAVSEVEREIDSEPSVNSARVIGAAVCENGGNGTLAAAGKF